MKLDKLVTLLGAALFISLSLNLFLAGLMAGRSYDENPGARWERKDMHMRERLSDSDRKILKDAMQANRAKFEALKKGLDDSRSHLQEAMQANDQDALKEALADETGKKEQLLRLMQDTRAAALEKLSPEGRKTLQDMHDRAEERSGAWRHPGDDLDLPPDLGGPDDPDVR